MKSHSLLVLGALPGLLSALGLAGCAANRMAQYDESPLQTAPESAELWSHRIRNWQALNDHVLIIESYEGVRYKAEMLGPCPGLAFSNRVGFSNRSGFQQIDRFSSVVLPDGTRCAFQSFNKVVTPESAALDSFEKTAEKSGSGATPR